MNKTIAALEAKHGDFPISPEDMRIIQEAAFTVAFIDITDRIALIRLIYRIGASAGGIHALGQIKIH